MTLLVLLAITILAALAAYAILATVRRRRTPPELRGDWWTRFEREFRAYASTAGGAARKREPRRRQPGSTS